MYILAEHISCFVASFLTLFNLNIYFRNMGLSKENKSIWLTVVINSIYLYVEYVSFVTDRPPIVNLAVQIILVSMVMIPYSANLLKKIILMFLFLIFSIFMEFIVHLSLTLFFYSELEHPLMVKINYLLGMLTSHLLSFMILNFIRIQKRNTASKEEKTVNALFLVLPVSSIFIIYCISEIILRCIEVVEQDTYALGILAMSVLAIINVYCYALLRKIQSVEKTKQENKILEEQNLSFLNQKEIIDQSQAIVSGVRHDMKNHIYSMLLFIDEPTSAKEYAENLLKQLEESENLCHSKNFMIDSIVNFKLQTIDREKINLTVDTVAPVDLNIPAYELTVILGNILDNTLTALSEMEENQFLSLRINTSKNHLLILLKNSYTGNLDIQNGKYQSTKQFKANHGIGISNVEQAVERCGGVLKIQHSDVEFMVSISLPMHQTEV